MKVAVAGMSADADTALLGQLCGLEHDIGITGMKSAGNIDTAGYIQHRIVIAHIPRAKTFAEIAVEIDFHKLPCPPN